MAETVSSCVKRIVDKSPFIHEMLINGILSYSNYASSIHSEVERLYTREVKTSAIVMALRRYADELRRGTEKRDSANVDYGIVMKTNIFDLNLSGATPSRASPALQPGLGEKGTSSHPLGSRGVAHRRQ